MVVGCEAATAVVGAGASEDDDGAGVTDASEVVGCSPDVVCSEVLLGSAGASVVGACVGAAELGAWVGVDVAGA